MTSQPISRSIRGVIVAVAPHPQSTTTRIAALPTSRRIDSTCRSTRSSRDEGVPVRSQDAARKRPPSRAASISFCWDSSNAVPSGFQSFRPLYGAGLWDAVTTTPQPYSAAPRARVGVETTPASTASAPALINPAARADTSIAPVVRESRPTIAAPYNSPTAFPTARVRSGVTSTFARPRMPEEPNRGTAADSPRRVKCLRAPPRRGARRQRLNSDRRMRGGAARGDKGRRASHGDGADQRGIRDREGEEEGAQARAGEGQRGRAIHEGTESADRSHRLGRIPESDHGPPAAGLGVERLYEDHEETQVTSRKDSRALHKLITKRAACLPAPCVGCQAWSKAQGSGSCPVGVRRFKSCPTHPSGSRSGRASVRCVAPDFTFKSNHENRPSTRLQCLGSVREPGWPEV